MGSSSTRWCLRKIQRSEGITSLPRGMPWKEKFSRSASARLLMALSRLLSGWKRKRLTCALEKFIRDWALQAAQGGLYEGSSCLVPSTHLLIPASHTKCTTGIPCNRSAQEVTSENPAFKLNPPSRVDALKNTTGASPAFAGTWLTFFANLESCRLFFAWAFLRRMAGKMRDTRFIPYPRTFIRYRIRSDSATAAFS